MNHKHGMCNTRTWKSWTTMLLRCRGNNEKAQWYADRGITVCDRWMTFSNFLQDMGERPAGCSLDRIDNDGPYAPSNCRWATKEQQARNKRTNVILEYNGKRQTLAEWSRELGINREAIKRRIAKGWPPEEIFSSHKFTERSGWYGEPERHSHKRKAA